MSFLIFDELISTNDYAKELAKKGTTHGTAVLARRQINGRGQYDREWYSPEGGMWLSIVLQKVSFDKEPITITFGKRIARTLEQLTNKKFNIKPPNDILYNGKKVCGILTELVTQGNKSYGVVGIGLNVNNRRFPSCLDDQATSLILIDEVERNIDDIAKRITNCILEENDVSSN